jgi:hypothetical protein
MTRARSGVFGCALVLGIMSTGCWQSIYPSLPQLVQRGNIADVRGRLDRGSDPNERDIYGSELTPLFVAAAMGRADMVDTLLDKKADPNLRAYDAEKGPTPLIGAVADAIVSRKSTDMIRRLIDRGANVNMGGQLGNGEYFFGMDPKYSGAGLTMILNMYGGEDGWTPLMLAAAMGRTEIVTFLLERHADVNIKNGRGLTAWMLALLQMEGITSTSDKQKESARLIIQAGAHLANASHAVVVLRSNVYFDDGNSSVYSFGGPTPRWAISEIRGGLLSEILVSVETSPGSKPLLVYYKKGQHSPDPDNILTDRTGSILLGLELEGAGIYCVDYDISGRVWAPRVGKY